MKTFIFNDYGNVIEYHLGQKVRCVYYSEHKDRKNSYRRTWLSKLIDKPFKPVKLGVIVGDGGIHPYWLHGGDGYEQYVLVKFKEYFLPKPIPISCIEDALEAAQKLGKFLYANLENIGSEGNSFESFEMLRMSMIESLKFARNKDNF